MASRTSAIAALSAAVEPVTAAALRGEYELLIAAAERTVERVFPYVSARMVVHTGGAWYESQDARSIGERVPTPLPSEATGLRIAHRFEEGVFVPLFPGALGLWVQGAIDGVASAEELPLLRQLLAMAVHTCERQAIAVRNLDEVQSLQRVAARMLKIRDVDEILLCITQQAKRLLASDICGVLLRESDSLVMKRCIGQRSAATANLHMDAGQGLAGLVLASAAPAAVEDYMTSEAISRDFVYLAEAELVRSALAAPLIGDGSVIGVLEVWRRRASVFTLPDRTRLVALANLTSIAIQNARLVASQRRIVDDLARANMALNERYDTIRSASELSANLTRLMLQGASLQTLTTTVAAALQAGVVIVALDGTSIAGSGDASSTEKLKEWLHAAASKTGAGMELEIAQERWRAQAIVVEGEVFGWVGGPIGPRGEALTDLALLQLAMLAALHQFADRAASRARAETIDALVWDLLRGDETARAAAIDRAAELKVDLSGSLVVVLLELGDAAPSPATHAASKLRQLITRQVTSAVGPRVRAIAAHGTSIVLFLGALPIDDIERCLEHAAINLGRAMDGGRVVAGASSRCTAPQRLPTAYREAVVALDVARQMGRSGAVIYDRAGVAGMLLSLHQEANMQSFLERNLGELLAQDEKQRETMLTTLRVFFDTNCSQEAAAQHLHVHRKTIAHRLQKISELTGLDLTTHDDRLLADLALYVNQLLARPSRVSRGSERRDDPRRARRPAGGQQRFRAR